MRLMGNLGSRGHLRPRAWQADDSARQRRAGAQVFPGPTLGSREKINGYLPNTQDKTMEAERINLIGNTLEDLAVRTAELRRYL